MHSWPEVVTALPSSREGTGEERDADSRDAIRTAKDYVRQVYEDEGIYGIGLEEIEFSDGDHTWSVTVGFDRLLPASANAFDRLRKQPRSYKVITIRDGDGRVLAMRHREVAIS